MMKREGKQSGSAAGVPDSPAEKHLEVKVRAASRALLIEKLWPRLWPPLAVCGIFTLLSIFEVWQLLPPRLHLGLLLIFGVAFVLSLVPLFLWRRPTRREAFDRLEHASALEHRPVTAFNDTINEDGISVETAALWKAHRFRAAAALRRLRAGSPHPRVDRYDPFALRAALILMLVAVAAWGSGDIQSRLRAAFVVPEFPAGSDFRVDAWISPPPYTRKEPFVLLTGLLSSAKDTVSVPYGSILTVKINGTDASRYRVAVACGPNDEVLKPSGPSSDTYSEFTQKLEQSGRLSIKRGFGVEKSWMFNVVPDVPPTIAFTGPVEISQRAVMLFKYKVDDDYGVVSAEARVERVVPATGKSGNPSESAPQIGKPPVFPLSLPRTPVRSADAKTYKDLTAHPWAGLPVVITLSAKDEAGNEGQSAPRGLILPERKFTKPLAKAVIDQRRALVEYPVDTRRVLSNLNALAITAEDEGISPQIYLGLRSAFWRLKGIPPIEDVETVVEQLWDVAIRIEDGNLSSTERELRSAQERLKDAIENGAPQEEIQRLMAELRQALNRYLQALAQQKPDGSNRASLSPNAKTVSPQDLQQLLSKIESLAKSGSAQAAAQMLNELRDILESLQSAKRGGTGSGEEDAESLQQMDRLTDMMRQQQQLLDETFRAQQGNEGSSGESGQRGQRGGGQKQRGQSGGGRPGGQPSAGDLKKRQDDLQRQLQELLSGMGPGQNGDSIRKKLQEAEGAMGDAGDALQQNELGEAGEQEGHALESLRQGTRAMAEQMMKSAGGMRGNSQANRDPLGRKQGGQLGDPGDTVKVPDEITVQRAREILDELRKRLGQPSRPPIELDYLERLIKPY